MAKRVRTLEDTVANLRGLSARVTENVDLLPDVSAEKSALDRALASFDEARTLQKISEAERRKATQYMATSLGRGKEAARQIRLAAQLGLGARNEKLVLFNVKPLRTNAGRRAAIINPPDEPGTPAGEMAPAHPTNP